MILRDTSVSVLADLMADGIRQVIERDPEGLFDLIVQNHRARALDDADEAGDADREGAACYVVQLPQVPVRRQGDTEFFPGFTFRGVTRSCIGFIDLAAREGDVAGPRVIVVPGALDEEQLDPCVCLLKYGGDRGAAPAGLIGKGRASGLQSVADVSKTGQGEIQVW